MTYFVSTGIDLIARPPQRESSGIAGLNKEALCATELGIPYNILYFQVLLKTCTLIYKKKCIYFTFL